MVRLELALEKLIPSLTAYSPLVLLSARSSRDYYIWSVWKKRPFDTLGNSFAPRDHCDPLSG